MVFLFFVASCLRVSLFKDLGHGVVEEQVALSHVLAEVTLHHAGVDEVFEKGGDSGAGSGIGFGKLDEEFHGAAKSAISWNGSSVIGMTARRG